MNIEDQVKDLIEKELEKEKIIVDEVLYLEEDNNMFLRIVIDKIPVVDINTCVCATKIINPLLDKSQIVKDSYILDITSKERGE